MFERFDSDARRAIVEAQHLAASRGEEVTVIHLAIGAAREGGLDEFEVDQDDVVNALVERLGEGGEPLPGSPRFTREGKKTLELSLREALRMGSNRITPGHVVLGSLRAGDPIVAEVLERFPIGDLRDVRSSRRRRGSRRMVRVRDLRFSPSLFTEGAEGLFGRLPSDRMITTHDVLLAMFEDEGSLAAKVLADLGVTREKVAERIEAIGTTGTTDEDPRQKALQTELTDLVRQMEDLDADARRAAAARLREALERLEGEAPAS